MYNTAVAHGVPAGGHRAAGSAFWVWDGGQWLVNAQAAGIPTGSQPVAGALVVWGIPNSASYGHVAYVDDVTSATHVEITECNYDWKGSCRTIWENPEAAPNLQGYIYGGLVGNGPGSSLPSNVPSNGMPGGSGISGGESTGNPTAVGQDVVQRVKGDFNGDGRSDIAILAPSPSGGSEIWIGLSNGSSFTDNGVWWSNPSAASRLKLATGDFNGDGRSDVAILAPGSSGGSEVWVGLSDGSKFADAGSWWSNKSWTASGVKLATGDFNGDGRSDIALLTPYGSRPSEVWVGLSDGSKFADAGSWWSNESWGATGLKFASGDFNGDGRSDIAVLAPNPSGGSEVWVGLSNGTSTFTDAGLWWSNGSWGSSGLQLG